MGNRIVLCILTMAVLLLSFSSAAPLQADESEGDKSKLTIPWDEFKQLLRLDEKEIVLSLDAFQKLVAQTGITTTPAHTMREGNVVLTRAEFEKLVNQMKPPAGPDDIPPFDFLITKAIYTGRMKKIDTSFSTVLKVHVLKKTGYVKVPILPQNIALEDVQVDGEQALVLRENGYHTVILRKSGEYTVDASFSMKSSLERGPHKIDISILETPITLLKLEIPQKDIEVDIPQAQHILTTVSDNVTHVSAVITPGRMMSVQWRKKVAVAEKIPSKLYCEIHNLVSIGDDALKINSDVIYNILHSEIDAVSVLIPKDVNVLSVTGEVVGEWQEKVTDDLRVIHIPFTYAKKGAVTVNVISEKTLPENGETTVLSGIRALDTVREIGFIGIELNTSAEVKVTESEGVEDVAVQKLPPRLVNKSVKPLMLGFKYLKHPYELVLDIEKHERIAVPAAAIKSASVVTLFTEDGKVVHRLVYQVRNNAKQFLEIQLPEESDVWSVFVGDQPVESSMKEQGLLLVPLIRSQYVNNVLQTFPVEIIYCLTEDRFALWSSKKANLPSVDLLVSQLIWSVYLPSDYNYLYFSSTLEKEEIIRGLNIFAGSQRQFDKEAMSEVGQLSGREADEIQASDLKKIYKGKDYRSNFRNLPVKEEELSHQVNAELEFSGRLEGLAQDAYQRVIHAGSGGTGALPIHIEVPTGGQVYRFARTIVKSEDELVMSVIYNRSWVMKSFKWLLFVIILVIVYINRKLIGKGLSWLGNCVQSINEYYRRNEKTLEKIAQSKVTSFIIFGLFLWSLIISRLMTLLTFFWLCVIVIYQISCYRGKKARLRSQSAEER
ncbi:MAG: hypothetical protein JSV33_13030 [bacterium]|nr:MAG: hypothetical protein JSV33_13030 [bacterium]